MVDRVAITGATGLVGRALVAALVARGDEVVVLARDPAPARGDEVVVLARDPAPARGIVPGAVDYLTYRQESDGDWTRALAAVDGVVNLAGASLFRPFTGRRYLRKVTQQRIDGTNRIATALRSAAPPPRVLVSASSVGVYGFGPLSDEEVGEDAAARYRATRQTDRRPGKPPHRGSHRPLGWFFRGISAVTLS